MEYYKAMELVEAFMKGSPYPEKVGALQAHLGLALAGSTDVVIKVMKKRVANEPL